MVMVLMIGQPLFTDMLSFWLSAPLGLAFLRIESVALQPPEVETIAFSAEAFRFELDTPVLLATNERPPVLAIPPILAIEDQEHTFWDILVMAITDLLTPVR